MNAQDLLDLLLDGEYVAWQITRENDSLQIVGLMQSGETVLIATFPISNLIEVNND